MSKRILPILSALILMVTLSACGAPRKVTTSQLPVCKGKNSSLQSVPYTKVAEPSCAYAITPFDTAAWIEAPLNSHKVRNLKTVDLGCKPLASGTDNCDYTGVPGHSNTLFMNFDMARYPSDMTLQKAVVAIYSPDNAEGLKKIQLRGRLNIGDELQSVGLNPTAVTKNDQGAGWVLFDISRFAARAINERRTSVSFEASLPCQTPANNLVTVGVLSNEPRLIVEYK